MKTYRCRMHRLRSISFLALLGLIFSACVLPSTPPPIPSQPLFTLGPTFDEATATQVSVLPILSQPEANPTTMPVVINTPTLQPTAMVILQDTPTSAPPPEITLLFTGVIVPARCVQSAIDARGDAGYVYDEVRETISNADLAIGTLNTTFSDLSAHMGCIFTYVLVSDSRSAAAAAAAGFDVMSVATNHIMNCSGASCGDNYNRAFFDTLDNLRANHILPVGAGMDLAEAMQPVVVEVKGVRFGIVSLGMVDAMRYAGENSPGIARLTDENLTNAIAVTRQVSDVVIAMPHWGPEDVPDPNSFQLHYAQVAVEAGADVVVGNHTHVVQAIQQIRSVDVFYGLGNFVFDQNWDLAHQQGVILLLHFSGTHYSGYELIPTHVDGDGTVHIAGEEEAAEILKRIQDASDRLR
ncbi:MAG TPA: CapA family protein [Anaerolineales bacterium]|nr:CapA family protein [Anaerolineales bacterium]